jgi:hypothetical protein
LTWWKTLAKATAMLTLSILFLGLINSHFCGAAMQRLTRFDDANLRVSILLSSPTFDRRDEKQALRFLSQKIRNGFLLGSGFYWFKHSHLPNFDETEFQIFKKTEESKGYMIGSVRLPGRLEISKEYPMLFRQGSLLLPLKRSMSEFTSYYIVQILE